MDSWEVMPAEASAVTAQPSASARLFVRSVSGAREEGLFAASREPVGNSETRLHLIVAFSDQMSTPQKEFIGTAAAAQKEGRRYATLHLRKGRHTHRRVLILDVASGDVSEFSLDPPRALCAR